MRTRVVELWAAVISIVAGSCQFPDNTQPSCDDDETLCPTSSRTATSVTCSCECTIGGGFDDVNKFSGLVAVCLPPALNMRTAAGDQRVALDAMATRAFDQRVYTYCSNEVAGFMRLAIKAQADLKVAACVLPVRCDCETKGASADSSVCHETCSETPCTAKNCRSILRNENKLDMAACSCSRATACGETVPTEETPGLCRDWLSTLQ